MHGPEWLGVSDEFGDSYEKAPTTLRLGGGEESVGAHSFEVGDSASNSTGMG